MLVMPSFPLSLYLTYEELKQVFGRKQIVVFDVFISYL
ncbi:hypothetical protein B4166_1640 [Caldibacillus thermoamylovorans]|uniref:Uncharacterized protein n=1 Tax=Caldibacillus thermoamylovorans TaxID=35841 RepID=A0ABD4A2C1_9BACI|nr:hypothetical protein B4166_1640 [Caldibacillus thermoamylovorans]KIO70522.1 hypothetical protein B4167_3836 [Caldibacillus thermoamylovorans]